MKFYAKCGFEPNDAEVCEKKAESPKKAGLKKAILSSALGYVGGVMFPFYALGVSFASLVMLRIYANVTWFGFLFLYTNFGLAATASLLLSAAAVYLTVRSIKTFTKELDKNNKPVATLVCGIVGSCFAAVGLFVLFLAFCFYGAFLLKLL